MSAEIISSLAADMLLILLPALYILSEKKKLPVALNALGFKKILPKALAKKTILLFAGLLAASVILVTVLSLLGISDLQNVQSSVAEMRLFPLFLCLVATRVVGEEVFFRGFLVQKIGLLGSTLVFALFHALYFSVAEIAGAFVLGLILAKTFQLNKNLYPNIIAHFAYNAAAIILFY
ncbi:MAG: type II CAAX endopeptidase family protein [Candidatus Diapherotrites archaeon]|nr:type II CAAX endopeptidase family protein [Candidatus Diapherotrites archaeon]